MLPGFEDITDDLTEYEQTVLLPVFVRCLAKKIGPGCAVTNAQICRGMKAKGYNTNGPRVRKIINHLRRHNLVKGLLASSKGYYISTDPSEVSRYIESLDGREAEIRRVKQTMIDYRKELLSQSQIKISYDEKVHYLNRRSQTGS